MRFHHGTVSAGYNSVSIRLALFLLSSLNRHTFTIMKNWFHSPRLRRQRSGMVPNFIYLPTPNWSTEALLLPIQKYDSKEVDDTLTAPKVHPVPNGADDGSKIAASRSESRISIERYLSAPLEDEPASVSAIKAALQRQSSSRSLRGRFSYRAPHSRESSFEAHSDGKWTGKGPASTGTSYSAASKANRSPSYHQRSRSQAPFTETGNLEEMVDLTNLPSPERPTTSGTIDIGKSWADQMDAFTASQGASRQVDYRLRAEEEIARIQEKARQLEEQIRGYLAERDSPEPLSTRVTDEMAYEQMAMRPKLAWILGGDVTDARSIERPKSSGSIMTTTTDAAARPSSSGTLFGSSQSKGPRRAKSSGALDESARQSALERRAGGVFERRLSKRAKFYCTFCLKRFHSRLEWMRHEQTIHMPEELWVCCPRTGEFPERCPFCAKSNPSPSHLADHNYFSCQKKSLSERTFNRQDHFLQHVSQVHKVSPRQKPLRLTELLAAWRHPLPLKKGHQALHCGFCGLTFLSYKERTEHVGKHFLEGLDMMSWWNERVSHDIPHPKPSEAFTQDP
jgi:hypothetical protein